MFRDDEMNSAVACRAKPLLSHNVQNWIFWFVTGAQ